MIKPGKPCFSSKANDKYGERFEVSERRVTRRASGTFDLMTSASRAARLTVLIALAVPLAACGSAKAEANTADEAEDEDLVIEREPPPEDEEEKPRRDDRDGLMKAEHRKCFREYRKNKGFKLKSYDILVTIRPDGTVAKVEPDESKTEVSDQKFMKCLAGKLKAMKFEPPRRELKAHLIYPE